LAVFSSGSTAGVTVMAWRVMAASPNWRRWPANGVARRQTGGGANGAGNGRTSADETWLMNASPREEY